MPCIAGHLRLTILVSQARTGPHEPSLSTPLIGAVTPGTGAWSATSFGREASFLNEGIIACLGGEDKEGQTSCVIGQKDTAIS